MIDDADVLYGEALERFRSLFERAGETGLKEPTAMNLATVDAQGRPSSRMVLLKHFDEHGFVFYTNRNSRKGKQLGGNPNAALCFFWDPLMEQVRIEGATVTVTNEEADDYWKTRSRNSQLGAWASFQSEPLDSRDTLEARFAQMRERFAEQPIPRPPHWSGYRMVPELIEFWVGVEFRLHERTCYRKAGRAWTVSLLNP